VDLAYSAADAALARINAYDVIILDLSLPDGTGIEILQELRREGGRCRARDDRPQREADVALLDAARTTMW